MGARAGKQQRNDNESKPKQQKRKFRFSTNHKEKNRSLRTATNLQDVALSVTTLYSLPLDMLDIILHKSYLHWILNSPTRQRDEDVITSLLSVDVCFNRRVTRRQFKKAIWRYLNDYYGRTKRRHAIIRNNRNYLLHNIRPNEELIASLLSQNCITEKQSHFIQGQRSMRDKNIEFFKLTRSFDEKKFSNFVKCLRQTNQASVAQIIVNGGGVIEMKMQIPRAKRRPTAAIETKLLHQEMEDLRNKMKTRSYKTDKFIAQLRRQGINILNSQQERQSVVVWIWCRKQSALEHIQKMYESNQLRDAFCEVILPSISMAINIDRNQFKKTVVVCPIDINFTQRIDIQELYLCGTTKLRNYIYLLGRSLSSAFAVISVFEDQTPFHLHNEIVIKEFKHPWDIGSNEKDNCLYICDYIERCLWKITRETDDQHTIINWLTTDCNPRTLSVSSDGQLLMINDSSRSLVMYGSDGELIRTITLPRDIILPRHAVQKSNGNFIIIHAEWEEMEVKIKEEWEHEECLERRERNVGPHESWWDIMLVVSELNRDGQMVVSRFIPSNEPPQVNLNGYYLSLDADDRVFVADPYNHRVILLESDLECTKIIRPKREENKECTIPGPWRMCYDEETQQLIVGGIGANDVNVYTLSRN